MKTFKRNLLLGYGISLLLLTVSSVASYVSIRNLLSSAELVTHTNQVIDELNTLMLALKDGEAGQRGYLLSRDSRFLTPYREAQERALESVREVGSQTRDNGTQQQDVTTLLALTRERFAVLQRVIQKFDRTGQTEAQDIESGRQVMEQLRSVVERMVNREQVLLVNRTGELNRFTTLTPLLIVLASLLALVVTAVSFARVNNDFEQRARLQRDLEEKDQEISTRLGLIEGIADQISSGNYKIKVDDEGN
ncbi:MAG: CHASE3 domain-containing protein, partial [Bacteroidetes bacterium]|nr:CHASE3 domain-containing protein [Bacteroidota bacterium]